MLAECTLVLLLLYTLWWHLIGKRKDYPPGPTPLPFLGNVLGVNFRYPERSFAKWSREHGPVFTFWLGPMPMVVITDFALLRKYGGDDFAGRADNFATQFMTDGFVGVLNAQGPVWKEQRRFSLHVLRDLGFGKNEMEPKIHAQIRKLVKHLEELTAESEDGAISVAYPIELAVGNVLSSVIFGTSYGREDPDFAEMRALNDEVMNLYTGPRIFLLLIYPWLRFIPVPGRFGFTAMLSVKKRFWSFFDRLLADCKARFDPLAPVTDFTAAYLRELHLRRKAGEDMGFFSEQRLVAIMADFAIAGMDTTRATMEWAVLFLLHHPKVQAKVQMEMDIYFATLHRPVSMTDRQSLPYTAATLMEVQRLTNVLPINLQHSTMRDCEVEGFRLKAGTPILAQISVVLTDERYFPDPYRFDPLRFLDENGNKLKRGFADPDPAAQVYEVLPEFPLSGHQEADPVVILGNILGVNFRYPERSFAAWTRDYGPVFTFWLGPMPMVAITDFNLLKKYGGDDFAGRADNFATQFFVGGNVGVLNAQGPLWKEQRRFSLHVLRDLGFGKNEMEPKIHAQIRKLVHHLDEKIAATEDGVIRVDYPIELTVGNIISSVMFGKNYERDDAEFAEMRALNDELMNLFTGPRIFLLLIYPWLRFIPVPGRFGFTAMQDLKSRFWSFFDRLLDDCKARFDPLAPVTDFTAAYLRELHLRNKAEEDLSFFSEKQLIVLMADFALAAILTYRGMDTTRATMEWAVLFLLHHPEVQAKVQMEMDIYFATLHRPVSMTDRQSLPYTAATLMEVQRLTNVLPINLQHSTMRDCEVEGFRLKAGTPILAQISAVLTDERYFPEPDRFEPLRYLDENANRLKKVEEWVPFGMGKRLCGGESLARMQLFLIFVELFRNFRFAPVPGKPLPTLAPQLKYTRSAQKYECLVTRRNRV